MKHFVETVIGWLDPFFLTLKSSEMSLAFFVHMLAMMGGDQEIIGELKIQK
jgi:hypothetical protein